MVVEQKNPQKQAPKTFERGFLSNVIKDLLVRLDGDPDRVQKALMPQFGDIVKRDLEAREVTQRYIEPPEDFRGLIGSLFLDPLEGKTQEETVRAWVIKTMQDNGFENIPKTKTNTRFTKEELLVRPLNSLVQQYRLADFTVKEFNRIKPFADKFVEVEDFLSESLNANYESLKEIMSSPSNLIETNPEIPGIVAQTFGLLIDTPNSALASQLSRKRGYVVEDLRSRFEFNKNTRLVLKNVFDPAKGKRVGKNVRENAQGQEVQHQPEFLVSQDPLTAAMVLGRMLESNGDPSQVDLRDIQNRIGTFADAKIQDESLTPDLIPLTGNKAGFLSGNPTIQERLTDPLAAIMSAGLSQNLPTLQEVSNRRLDSEVPGEIAEFIIPFGPSLFRGLIRAPGRIFQKGIRQEAKRVASGVINKNLGLLTKAERRNISKGLIAEKSFLVDAGIEKGTKEILKRLDRISGETRIHRGFTAGGNEKRFIFQSKETEEAFQQGSLVVLPGQAGLRSFNVEKISGLEAFKKATSRGSLPFLKRGTFGDIRKEKLEFDKVVGISAFNTDLVIKKYLSAGEKQFGKMSQSHKDVFWKKVLLDDLEHEVKIGNQLPSPWTPAKVRQEMQRIKSSDIFKDGRVQAALKSRSKFWREFRETYISEMEAIGLDVSQIRNNPNYFRHQVVDLSHIQSELSRNISKKARKPRGQSFLKERKGSNLPIQTGPLPEAQVIRGMFNDISTAKFIKAFDKHNKIKESVRKAKKFRKANKEAIKSGKVRSKTYEDFIPEGHSIYNLDDQRAFFSTNTISDRVLKELGELNLTSLGVSADDIKKMTARGLVMGKKKFPMVLPDPLVKTLNQLEKDAIANAVDPNSLNFFLEKATSLYKEWILTSPIRILEYNANNATSDLFKTVQFNPKALRPDFIMRSIREMFPLVSGNYQNLTNDAVDFARKGGFFSASRIHELGGIKDLKRLQRMFKLGNLPKTDGEFLSFVNGIRQNTQLLTDYREMILRYSNFLSINDDLFRSGGKVTKYYASNPREVDALATIGDKAYKMSQDMLGRFDDLAPITAKSKRGLIPFASWKQVNAESYINGFANMVVGEKESTKVLKKLGFQLPVTLVGAASKTAVRLGAFSLKASIPYGISYMWNNTGWRAELESDLSREDKIRPHIWVPYAGSENDAQQKVNIPRRGGRAAGGRAAGGQAAGGKTKEIKVPRGYYQPWEEALFDFSRWFGGERIPGFWEDLKYGKINLGEFMAEVGGKQPLNQIYQGVNPFVKFPIEGIFRQNTFPDIWRTRPIKDDQHKFWRILALGDAYRVATGTPTRQDLDSVMDVFFKKVVPKERAFYQYRDEVREFLRQNGRDVTVITDSPLSDVRWHMYQAARASDVENGLDHAEEQYRKWIINGGNPAKIISNFKNFHPDNNIPKDLRAKWLKEMTPETKRLRGIANQWFQIDFLNKAKFYKKLGQRLKAKGNVIKGKK